MAEGTIGGTPISALPPSSFAYCEPGSGSVSERCHFPIRDKSGKADAAHVRNALARLSTSPFEAKARPKVEAAAKELGIGTPAGKAMAPVKATVLDDDHFRLLAIPFDGPIPSPYSKRGMDLDGQWFDPAVDIKPDWLSVRLVDFHHGYDGAMGRTVVGKAVLDPEPDDDGWWVETWLERGRKHVEMVRRLAERGAQLFGSSESIKGVPRMRYTDGTEGPWAAKTPGAITYWPYWRQTLSPAPQNTRSVLVPMKASLDEYAAEGITPTGTFFDDLAAFLDNLSTPPDSDLTSELSAKAGRVLAARNEARLREALHEMAAVLEELDRYVTTQETPP